MTDDRSGGGVFRSRAHRRRALLAVAALVGTVAAVTGALWWVEPRLFDPGWVRARIAAAGPAAPAVFVLLQAAQVVLAPVPGQVLAGIGGYLFGSLLGTIYSMLGVTLGSTVVFAASRRYGRPFVARVLTEETLNRVDGFVDRYGSVGLFVAFVLPTFPDDALCTAVGLTELRYWRFLLLLLVGRTPTFLAAAFAGTSLAGGDLERALAVMAGLLTVSVLVYRFRSELSDRLRPLID